MSLSLALAERGRGRTRLAQSDWVSPQQSAETLAKKAEADGLDFLVFGTRHPTEIGWRTFADRGRVAEGGMKQ